jgi:predicted nucleic acid-binding protein
VWVEHLRRGHPDLIALLDAGVVLLHPFVLGELACGHIRQREQVLILLRSLPTPIVASDEEVMAFIHRHSLHGLGIGWVDAHLLASARLSSAPLFTLDRALVRAATALGIPSPH